MPDSPTYEAFDWKKRFDDTAELLPGIICEIDREGYLTWVNRMGLEAFKYTREEFDAGLHLSRIIHPDDLVAGTGNVASVMKGEGVGRQEYRMIHSDGTQAVYEANSSPIYEGDRIVGMRSVLFDVSDRKAAEARIRESEERFRRIFTQSPSGAAMFETDGELVEFNGAFVRMFGMDPDAEDAGDFPGLFELMSLEEAGRARLREGAVLRGEAQLDARGRNDAYLGWTAATLGFGGERPELILLQVQDLTELRRAQEARLEEARLAEEQAKRRVKDLQVEVLQKHTFMDMVSRSQQMAKIFGMLEQVADTSTTVMVYGESGTGKELVARAIHGMSPRAGSPFVAINCGALPDNLLESELFGYKAGAFTDAKKDKPGKFAQAQGGVVFLDEIGDISQTMQVKLLRVLQERVFEPLGGTGSVEADVRIIAATNKDLPVMVKAGAFRDDLFYRLNVIKIKLPPLRDRRSDIPLLCEHFVSVFNRRFDRAVEEVSKEALDALLAYDFPGNIRELENVMEHAFVFCKGDKITPAHLPEEISGKPCAEVSEGLSRFASFEDLEAAYLRSILEETGGSRLEAARRLGIHKSTLFRKLKSLGINEE